jgi:uroporphyrinogen-III synthase
MLERAGIAVAFRPSISTGAAMAGELPFVRGDRILVVRCDLADEGLAATLATRGAQVDDVVAYRTREAPEASRRLLQAAVIDGSIAAVVFTSGSTIRGLLSLGEAESIDVRSFPAVCIGPETADEARAAGFRILAISPTPTSSALATSTASALALQLQETP